MFSRKQKPVVETKIVAKPVAPVSVFIPEWECDALGCHELATQHSFVGHWQCRESPQILL